MSLLLRNPAASPAVDLQLLRRIIRTVLQELPRDQVGELGVYLVNTEEIVRLNETFLHHGGPTDVISFDYAEPGSARVLTGEIFICLDEARKQARRFRVSWQRELVRYIVHGLLHLCGYDDQQGPDRRRMKKEEDRLVRLLDNQFSLHQLGRTWTG